MASSKGDAFAARGDFWNTTFPTPNSPSYSQRRLLSSCILGTFLFVFLFLATSSLDGDRFHWLGDWVFASGQTPVEQQSWLLSTSSNASRASSSSGGVGQTVLNDEDEEEGSETATTVSSGKHKTESHYGAYVWHDKLDKSSLAGRRLIFIGDIHGTVDSLRTLLSTINYSSNRDQLIFVGDLVAKSSLADSLDTVSFVRQLGNVKSVRGNHDQHVISWRAWMEAARSQMRDSEGQEEGKDSTVNELQDWALLTAKRKPKELPSYPEGWEWGSEHFHIARKLTKEDWAWYKSLPLSIYVPHLRAFVVHAGMLSTLAPTKKFELPTASSAEYLSALNKNKDNNSTLTSLSQEIFLPSPAQGKALTHNPETAALMQIQNRDPWTLLDVRGVRHGGSEPTRKTKGKKWFKLWNEAMEQCSSSITEQACLKQNIIYGHWAGEGLTVKDHTFGLDTGCVYGRSLSALIMDENSVSDLLETSKTKVERVEINGQAGRVVSISCKN